MQLEAITEVTPTRNPLSSSALSFDRLRVTYGAGLFRSVRVNTIRTDLVLDLDVDLDRPLTSTAT